MEVLPTLGSSQYNLRKYMGIPNCLAIARALFRKYFRYVGVLLTEVQNENALSLAINLPYVSVIFLNCLCYELNQFHFVHCKFIDEGI